MDLLRLGWRDPNEKSSRGLVTIVGVSGSPSDQTELGYLSSAAFRCNCEEGGLASASNIVLADVGGNFSRGIAKSAIDSICGRFGRQNDDYSFEFERISVQGRRFGRYSVVLADVSFQDQPQSPENNFCNLVKGVFFDRGWSMAEKDSTDPESVWFMRFRSKALVMSVAAVKAERKIVEQAIPIISSFLAPTNEDETLFGASPREQLFLVTDRKAPNALRSLSQINGIKVIHFSEIPLAEEV